MKNISLFTLFLSVSLLAFAQDNTIKLKSGKFNFINGKQLEKINNIKYYFMLFSEIPTIEVRNKITNLGVKFLEYIPNKTYVVNLDKECDLSGLINYSVISLSPILGEHKLDPKIQNDNYPKWAINNGKLSIKVLLYKDVKSSFIQ